MSYVDRAQDPARSAKAIVAVGAIHAALAYVLVTGLGTTIMDHFGPPPLAATQIPLDPPPEPKDPGPTPPQPTAQRPVAPLTPIDLLPQRPDQVEVAEPNNAVIDYIPAPDPPARLDPQPPVARFTPQGARPTSRPASWISNSDYPRRALVDEAEGSGRYRLIIGTTGRVSSCEVTVSTGNRQLDDATCRLITSRARFEPATDESGTKVVGSYSGSVRWDIPE